MADAAMIPASRIHIIVNPASGGDRPVLSIFNEAFQPLGVDWQVFVTKAAGDARRYALEAMAAGVDAIGVYGGDGTVMEVAGALVGQRTPLAIFPGGTANALAIELGIPNDPAQACGLVSDRAAFVREIDVGQVGEHVFVLRLGVGLEAAVIEATGREQKDRMGWVAYALNTLREMADPKLSQYRLTIDGRMVEVEGLVCMIANSGILSHNSAMPGLGPIRLAPTIYVDDGLLDVVVIRRGDLGALLAVAASMLAGNEDAEPMLHWQGREIVLDADPPQAAQADGELVGQVPLSVRVLPRALRVLVPGAAAPTAGFVTNDTELSALDATVLSERPPAPHVRPPL